MRDYAVGPETSVLEAYSVEERLFERLVAYMPVFQRFAHVLSDEELAGKLRLSDVAAMVGVPAGDVADIANGGMPPAPPSRPADPPDAPPPSWLWEVSAENVRHLDVRSLLEKGHGPLAVILDAVAAMPVGGVLAVDATFHPVPLRRLLEHRGCASHAECHAQDHWRIYFRT